MAERFLAKNLRLAVLCSFLLLWISGCAGKAPYLQQGYNDGSISTCSVAILPLWNKTSYLQGGRVVGRILHSQLARSGGFYLALNGDVKKIYDQLRIRPWMTPAPEQLHIIADRLGVDALVGGEVLEMSEQTVSGQVLTKLSVQLRVYRAVDGTQLFATYHSRRGEDYRTLMHFGLINTISGLSEKVIQEILELWKEKRLLSCPD